MYVNITWHDGTLTVIDADDDTPLGSMPWEEPITAGTDSHDVVNAVCDHFGWSNCGGVDHDKDNIFAIVEPGPQE